jgi:Skp family chaperone for outer membrane proteins
LIWTEYTRLAKEVAAAAFFGASIERAIAGRSDTLKSEFAGRPAELDAALEELAETMAGFERARDPDDLTSED